MGSRWPRLARSGAGADNVQAMRRPTFLLATLGLVLAGFLLGASPVAAQEGQGPRVEVFEAGGVLDASTLDALRENLAGARERGTTLFLIQLDSFGGLGVTPEEARRVVAEAGVPVAVWVGPRQAQAAGAAAFLLAGADVVGASHEARIGPALPAELGRGRDAAAERAAFDSSGLPEAVAARTITGAQAVRNGLADYEAESLPDAVARLDGREAGGQTLSVEGFQVRFLSRSLPDRVRHGLANPTIAYLMILAAACCLAFEWFQPGFGVAGVAGLLVAALAAWALVILPTNWLALAALLAGLVVFTLDTAMGGLGLGTLAAAALTGAGSWWLFSSPSPLLRLDGRLAALGVAWCLIYWVAILTVTLRGQRTIPPAGEALVGAHGIVRSMLNPGGIVVIDGAVWRAHLIDDEGSLPTGQKVVVERVVGGILHVRPENPGAVRRPGQKRRDASAAPAGEQAAAVEGTQRDA